MTDPLPSAGAAASAATRTSNPSSATTMSTVASNTGSHGASALLSSGLSKEVVSENIFPFLDYKSIIRCMTVKPIADAFCLEQYYCIEHGRKLVPQDGLWKEFKEAHSGGDDDEEVGVSQEELWKQIEIENNNNSTQEEETSNSPPTSNSHDKEKQSGKMDQHTCNSFQQPECPDCLEGTLFNRERCPNCSQEGGDDVWIRQCSKCPARSCNECDESIFNCEGCDEEFCHPRCDGAGEEENLHYCEVCDDLFCPDCCDISNCHQCKSPLGHDIQCKQRTDFFYCDGCQHSFCQECSCDCMGSRHQPTCKACGTWFCRECQDHFYCKDCRYWYCNDCKETFVCQACGEKVCRGCSSLLTCETCVGEFCGGCCKGGFSCGVCQKSFCRSSCSPPLECEFCRVKICGPCQEHSSCRACSKTLCGDCSSLRVSCGICHGEFCEDCPQHSFCHACEQSFCNACKDLTQCTVCDKCFCMDGCTPAYYCRHCDGYHCVSHGDPPQWDQSPSAWQCPKKLRAGDAVTCPDCATKAGCCPVFPTNCFKGTCDECNQDFQVCCCGDEVVFATKKSQVE